MLGRPLGPQESPRNKGDVKMAQLKIWPQRDTFQRLASEWLKANPQKTLEDLAALWPMKVGPFRVGLMYGKRYPTEAHLLRASAIFGVHPAVLMGDRFPDLPFLAPDYLKGVDPLHRDAILETVEILTKLPTSRLPDAVGLLRHAVRLLDQEKD